MTDVDECARAEGMPSDAGIGRVGQLITRIRLEMSEMEDEDRKQVIDAVDRTFLYRHRDLVEQIHVAISAPPDQAAAASLVSRASLQTDLLNAHERNRRLAARVRQLETRLSEAL